MTNNEKLKPCKCGGKIKPWFGEKMNAFECLRCGYQTIIEIPDSTIKQAIAAWNNRQGKTE